MASTITQFDRLLASSQVAGSNQPLHVMTVDTNGAYVAGAGGGTPDVQYTEGDTDTTITGNAIMFESNTGTSALAVVNASTPLPVVQTGALPAGANVIGHVIVDTTSTTAVTQATGTNLHAVIDTGSTTAVTQATGTNLHAVIDSGSTTAVTGNVATTVADGANVVEGATTGAAIVTDTNGTIQQYLRGLVKGFAAATTFGTIVRDIPDATATYAPTNATSTVYATNLVVKAGAGVLFSVTGYNSKTSSQFIQVHNTTSLPADTAVPILIFLVSATSNFSLDFGGKFGRYFGTGITLCNSSTGPTKTIGSADCWFDVQYS